MDGFNININSIVKKEEIKDESLKNQIPEGAIYFEGIVSNGEKNRNGYIIKPEAWFIKNGKYVKDFLKNGSVLYGHNPDKPIGSPLSFELKEDGNIWTSGYVYDDMYTNGAISRGLIKGFSTGHLTHSSFWEREDGKTMTTKEFSEKIWSDEDIWKEYQEGLWTWVVDGAEIVEYSFVTTPSNRASVLNKKEEVLANEISKNLNIDLKEVEKLFLNNTCMSKKDIKKEEEKVETNKVETKETPKKEENKVEVLENKIETLENSLKEKENEVEALKNDLETKTNLIKKLEENISKKEEEQKQNILANAKIEGKEEKEIDLNSFQEKYSA